MTLHPASDLFFLMSERHGAAKAPAEKEKAAETQPTEAASCVPLTWSSCSRTASGGPQLTAEETKTDTGGFLNIYLHYGLPWTWQAGPGMAVNVVLINRWRV